MNCDHCGLSFTHEPHPYHTKNFCCIGCSTVYQLIENHNLKSYYSFHPKAGNIPPSQTADYSYLGDEAFHSKFVTFQDKTTEHAKLSIPNIHCSACIWILEQLNQFDNGIHWSRVNFSEKTIRVSYEFRKTSLQKICERLSALGYPPEMTLSSNKASASKTPRKLWMQIGVAGFAFGNIMFLSLATYFDSNEYWILRFRPFFEYLMFIMSIPVVFYSGKDFYISAWKGLKNKWLSLDVPIALGISVLFIKSCHAVFVAGELGYFDSLAGLVFFLLIGKYVQQRSYQSLSFDRDYTAYFPIGVTQVDSDGLHHRVPLEQIQKGDVLFLKPEELIPIDGKLISDEASIDYSFVTGEAKRIKKIAQQKVYAGGRICKQSCMITACTTIKKSELIQLWNQDTFQKKNSPFEKTWTHVLGRNFTAAILTITALTCVIWGFIEPSKIPEIAAAILIVACPCALALAGPFVLGNMLQYFGKHSFYIKNTATIERLGRASHLVFDKTGTLTNTQGATVEYIGNPLSEKEAEVLRSVFYQSHHPLSKSIEEFLSPCRLIVDFESETFIGLGIKASINQDQIKVGSEDFIKVPENSKTIGSVVYVEINGNYRGCFKILQAIRPQLVSMFKKLTPFSISLLSGDSSSEKNRFKKILPKHTTYVFKQTPFDKIKYIKGLQANHEQVVMIGDGLNDAGALKQSNVGIAVSEHKQVFTPASDAIIYAKKIHHLPEYLWAIQKSKSLVKICVIGSLSYNLVGIGIAVIGKLSPIIAAILMPLSSISVVVFASASTYLLHKKLQKMTLN